MSVPTFATPRALLLLLFASTIPSQAFLFGTSVGHPVHSLLPPRSHSLSPTSHAATATSGTAVDYGGIPHVAVLVGSAPDALRYYTDVLGMDPSSSTGVTGAVVRIGAQLIHLLELPNPDPIAVDPSYNMSAPPPGYVANGRPVHAGRDRHVAITLDDLEPLKASLESHGVEYTMSYSGRQALFCRDEYGNGWEFGPAVTYQKATRLFPPYLIASAPSNGRTIGYGGVPHVGLLVSSTPAARRFYCDVLGMVDETDLRPEALPFPGLFLRCGEQQVHILELPNPDPNTVGGRPGHGRDRRTTYSVKSLGPVRAGLEGAGVEFTVDTLVTGEEVLYCYDPDANELMFVEDGGIQVIQEDMVNMAPMLPWTRLW